MSIIIGYLAVALLGVGGAAASGVPLGAGHTDPPDDGEDPAPALSDPRLAPGAWISTDDRARLERQLREEQAAAPKPPDTPRRPPST